MKKEGKEGRREDGREEGKERERQESIFRKTYFSLMFPVTVIETTTHLE